MLSSVQDYPFVEDFEAAGVGGLADYWTTSVTNDGIVRITDNDDPRGGYHLELTQFGNGDSIVEAVLKLDLQDGETPLTGITLDFWTKMHTGSLFVRQNDTDTWKHVANFEHTLDYMHYVVDLDQVVADRGLSYTDVFEVRFYNSGSVSSGTLFLDDVRVMTTGEDLFGPQVVSHSPNDSISGLVGSFDVTFDEAINPISFSAADVQVTGPLGNAISVTFITTEDNMIFTVNFESQSLAGNYNFTIGPDIIDASVRGNLMNQDEDCRPGETNGQDSYLGTFILRSSPWEPPSHPPELFFEDFEGWPPIPSYWSFNTTDADSISVLTNESPKSGRKHLQISGGSNRSATLQVDLSAHSNSDDLFLDFWAKRELFFAVSIVELSVDSRNWATVLNIGLTPEFTRFNIDLDEAAASAGVALGSNVSIRFRHNGGGPLLLDNVRVIDGPLDGPALTVSIDRETISEGDGSQAATGIVTRMNVTNLDNALIVKLTSNDTSEANVMATVEIPIGSASAPFFIEAINDDDVDGPQVAIIIAEALDYFRDSRLMTVNDDEPSSLVLDIPLDVVSEELGGLAAIATIWRNKDFDEALDVLLESSDVSEVSVPDMVTIPAGAESADFPVFVVNDPDLDGPQIVNILAHDSAEKYVADVGTLTVDDDDTIERRTIGGQISAILPPDDYYVLSDLIVVSGSTMVAQSGTSLWFEDKTRLIVDGTLSAIGEPANPIIFTSANSSANPGDWYGIDITHSGVPRSIVSYTEISFAATGIDISGNNPKVSVSHNDIHHNLVAGVSISASGDEHISEDDVFVLGNTIHNNSQYGIVISASSGGNVRPENTPSILGNNVYRNGSAGIRVTSSYSHSSFAIVTGAQSSPIVIGNYVHKNGTGISLFSTRSRTAKGTSAVAGMYANNLIVLNAGDGLLLEHFNSAQLAGSFLNNTIADNEGAGFRHDESNTYFANNIVANNLSGLVSSEIFTPRANSVTFNLAYSNSSSDWVGYPTSYGQLITTNANGTAADFQFNISVDPHFVGLGDYHLQPNSPLVNAGTADGAPVDDFDGDPRVPLLNAIDIGYDEVDFGLPAGDFDLDGDADGSDFLTWQRGFRTTDIAGRGDGDSNNDGNVDADDLLGWTTSFSDRITAPPSADFDLDGDTDGQDFLMWQRGFGTTGSAAKADGDANNNRNVDSEDLVVWGNMFGDGQSVVPSADFDQDNDTDGQDFLTWQRGFGITGTATKADGNADGNRDVDAVDLSVWKQQFGSNGMASLATVATKNFEVVESLPLSVVLPSSPDVSKPSLDKTDLFELFLPSASAPIADIRLIDAAIAYAISEHSTGRIADEIFVVNSAVLQFYGPKVFEPDTLKPRSDRYFLDDLDTPPTFFRHQQDLPDLSDEVFDKALASFFS